MRLLPFLLAAACVISLSCERHEFGGKDGTRQLHESHGAHAGKHEARDAHDADPDKGAPRAP